MGKKAFSLPGRATEKEGCGGIFGGISARSRIKALSSTRCSYHALVREDKLAQRIQPLTFGIASVLDVSFPCKCVNYDAAKTLSRNRRDFSAPGTSKLDGQLESSARDPSQLLPKPDKQALPRCKDKPFPILQHPLNPHLPSLRPLNPAPTQHHPRNR